MALIRIPTQVDVPTRTAFQDIENQLSKIYEALGTKGDESTVASVKKAVDELQEGAVPGAPGPLDGAQEPPFQVGPDGDTDEVLHEDLTWRDPLQGVVKVATGPGLLLGGTIQGAPLVQVAGNLNVLGKASIGNIGLLGTLTGGSIEEVSLDIAGATELPDAVDQDTDYLPIYDGSTVGNKKVLPKFLSGNQPFSVRNSSGTAFTAAGTSLTAYDYTFPSRDLQLGDVIYVWGRAVLAGTTAGTKSLTLAVGTGSPTTIWTSSTTTNATVFVFRAHIYVRSDTQVLLDSITTISTTAAAPTLYYVSATQTVSSIVGNGSPQLIHMVGTNSGSDTELKMTDYFIQVFRAGGNSTAV